MGGALPIHYGQSGGESGGPRPGALGAGGGVAGAWDTWVQAQTLGTHRVSEGVTGHSVLDRVSGSPFGPTPHFTDRETEAQGAHTMN